MDGISQNLHKALQTHSRHAHEDITQALAEHARTVVLYEKQLLRELESLRNDFSNINKKTVLPAVPPHVQPPQRTMSAQDVVPPRERVGSFGSQAAPVNGHSGHNGRNGGSIDAGGRMDGTKSMFINPPSVQQHIPAPGSPLVGQPTTPRLPPTAEAGPSTPVTPNDPLGAPGPMHPNSQRFDPGVHGRPGLTNSQTMARSMYVEPTRRRLDAREAASKLANFL